jgi:hypothetical protein
MFGEGGNGGAHPDAERDKGWLPVTDPTLGVSVDGDHTGQPVNQLVTIGDSITHGFISGAILRTVVGAECELLELPPAGPDSNGAALGHQENNCASDPRPEPPPEVRHLFGRVLVVRGHNDIGEPAESRFGLGAVVSVGRNGGATHDVGTAGRSSHDGAIVAGGNEGLEGRGARQVVIQDAGPS